MMPELTWEEYADALRAETLRAVGRLEYAQRLLVQMNARMERAQRGMAEYSWQEQREDLAALRRALDGVQAPQMEDAP
jgi:hypothetical protein